MIRILLILFIIALVFYNCFFFYKACQEKNAIKLLNNTWLTESQVINPRSTTGLPSIVMVHGYVGSPNDYKILARDLASVGFRINIPVIPGQTSNTHAFKRGTFTPYFYINWLTKIIQDETKITGKKPYLVGFSMGGTMSTIIAAKGIVKKVVLLAPFYSLRTGNEYTTNIAQFMRWLIPIVPKTCKGKINDSVGYNKYQPGSMLMSVNAFLQLEKLSVIAGNCIPNIDIPIMLVFSPNDEVASFHRASTLFSVLKNVQIKKFPHSNHILLYDYDRESINKVVLSFLKETQQSGKNFD